jgi:hypothetical protein
MALLLFTAKARAQPAIEVGKGGYFINGQKIEAPVATTLLTGILGKDYRIFDGINTIYTYDQLGLRLYERPNSGVTGWVYIDFRSGPYRFWPKQVFAGVVNINGYKISKGFTRDSLRNLADLYFDRFGSLQNGYKAVTFDDVTLYFTFNDQGAIASVEIGRSAIAGDFKTRAGRSAAQATVVNLDFNYEKGASTPSGKKTGMWEYYDEPSRLALRYDHDADTVLYQQKPADDFVLGDGEKWFGAKPDIYPRVIGSYSVFKRALASLIGYPALAREQQITGRVYVSFVIDKRGSMQQLKIEQDIGGNCGAAVVRALTLLKPRFTTAVKGTVSYESRFLLPVVFAFDSGINTAIPPSEKPVLPAAYVLPQIDIIAYGTPQPVSGDLGSGRKTFGLWECWTIGLLDVRTFGLSDFGIVGFWTCGLLDFRTSAL